ncbi:MAG TPA: cupin domain-containing protein [Acidobacteriaceae bacterium]
MYRHTRLTAAEIKEILHLVPHFEGGSYRRTYESEEKIAPAALDARYTSERHTGTAIYYLLEPGTFSEIHRLKSDEIFHFYLGDPVEMLQLAAPRVNVTGSAEPENDPGMAERIIIGNDLAQGHRPQVLAPQGVWQGSRLLPGGSFALLGCTVSPGFEREDYEAGDRYTLIRQWPEFAVLIRELTR